MARSGSGPQPKDELLRIADNSQFWASLRYRDAKASAKDVGRGITEEPDKVRERLKTLKSDDIKDRGFLPKEPPPKRRRGPVRLGK